MAVGEDYPVSAVTNADCSMSVIVTTWLMLYPHATFRAMLRQSLGDPVVIYEWQGEDGGDFLGEIKVITAGDDRLLLMKMPARDAKRIGRLSGVYDIVIEDEAINMKRRICGGTFDLSYGVTE
jgi:hypothetical protein